MGRWSYITLNGRNKKKLTIISAYRAGKTRIQESGPSTAFTQQWDFMEERGDESINVRKQMTKDLTQFIKNLTMKRHEVILCIDANEEFDTGGKGIAKLVSDCHLTDPIAQAHGHTNEPETYIRGKDRIDFIFCTLNIAAFVTASGITAYDEIAPSDHRGEFVDIQMQKFLANSFQEVTDHTSRKLQTRDSAGVITYKDHLRDFTTTHKIFDRIDSIQSKIEKDILILDDMVEINDLDTLITRGMIASENKIKKRQNQYPWSPILDQAILSVSLWKLITSEIKNEVSKEMHIQRILRLLDTTPTIERHDIKIVIQNLRKAKTSLKQIQRDATHHREKYLQQKSDEEEIKGNIEHARYLRMLIFIETQVEMHSTIRKFKTKNGQSNITYIDIPKDTSMDWNEIPKTLPKEEWKRIEDPVMVEKYIMERNKRHLNQAQGTPCTIEPLQSLLGLDSRTPFGNSVLNGTVNLNQLPLTKLQQLYFKEMKKTEQPLIKKVKNKISLDEMKYAFTKWKEQTTTSPS